ncbi:MAG: caspase family protein [Pseudomonadota bacterium]
MYRLLHIVAIFFAMSAASAIAAVGSTPDASAVPRMALVIGNNQYDHVLDLQTAVNDARAMASTLRDLGVEVTLHENVDRREMYNAIGQFADRIKGKAAIVYYAGHGVAVNGANFLLPTDIQVRDEREVEYHAIRLDRILSDISTSGAKLSVVFLDACRDNPLPQRVSGRSIGSGQGLGYTATPNGTMVIYSAGINEKALDRLGPHDTHPNGLFVRELLPELKTPGVPLYQAVRTARERIRRKAREVRHEQNPAIYDQLEGGEFYLAGPRPQIAALPPVTQPVQISTPLPSSPVAPPAPSKVVTTVSAPASTAQALQTPSPTGDFTPNAADWLKIQRALQDQDYGLRTISGRNDLSTRVAIRRWQSDNNLEANGTLDLAQFRRLVPEAPATTDRLTIASLEVSEPAEISSSLAAPVTRVPNIIVTTRDCSKAVDQHYQRLWPEAYSTSTRYTAANVLESCNAAIRQRPDNGSFFYWRGLVNFDAGKHQWALEDFEHALKLDGPSAGLIKKAQAIAALGHQQAALAAFDQAIRRGASPIEAYYWRAMLRFELGQTSQAIRDLQQLQRRPTLGRTQNVIWLHAVMRLAEELERRAGPNDARLAMATYADILSRFGSDPTHDALVQAASSRHAQLQARTL